MNINSQIVYIPVLFIKREIKRLFMKKHIYIMPLFANISFAEHEDAVNYKNTFLNSLIERGVLKKNEVYNKDGSLKNHIQFAVNANTFYIKTPF